RSFVPDLVHDVFATPTGRPRVPRSISRWCGLLAHAPGVWTPTGPCEGTPDPSQIGLLSDEHPVARRVGSVPSDTETAPVRSRWRRATHALRRLHRAGGTR